MTRVLGRRRVTAIIMAYKGNSVVIGVTRD